MTDLDRLKQISAAASTGLPPPTNEDRRFLLRHIENLHYAAVLFRLNEGNDVYAERERELARACEFTIPPKRCEQCGGEGKTGRCVPIVHVGGRPVTAEHMASISRWIDEQEECPDCNGTGYRTRCPKCNGWGLYGGEQCAECKGSGCQEAVT